MHFLSVCSFQCNVQLGNSDPRRNNHFFTSSLILFNFILGQPPRIGNPSDGVVYFKAKAVEILLDSGVVVRNARWLKIIPQLPVEKLVFSTQTAPQQESSSSPREKTSEVEVIGSVERASGALKIATAVTPQPQVANARSRLHEVCQKYQAKLEFIEQESSTGFCFLCMVNNQPVAMGVGSSKKIAQENAAAQALVDAE
jgi:hypothetical protein